jgi:hypothetical protein
MELCVASYLAVLMFLQSVKILFAAAFVGNMTKIKHHPGQNPTHLPLGYIVFYYFESAYYTPTLSMHRHGQPITTTRVLYRQHTFNYCAYTVRERINSAAHKNKHHPGQNPTYLPYWGISYFIIMRVHIVCTPTMSMHWHGHSRSYMA